jgi:sorting nexin-14
MLFINNFYSRIFLIVAEGPYIDVVKLQTMRCLFEAYEHVLSLLENVFTPMFYHSDEVSQKLSRLNIFIQI